MTGSPRRLRRALAYARHGWPVFPCRPGRKEPATPHGFKDATTDPGRITGWWPATRTERRHRHRRTRARRPRRRRPARPAADTPPSAGSSAPGCSKAPAPSSRTPSGGLHAYYAGTGQRSGQLPGHHLDFKAAGGYVLAPPSHVGGKPYRLVQHRGRPAAGSTGPRVTLLDPPQQQPQRPQAARPSAEPRPAGRLGRPASPRATGTPACSGPPAAPPKPTAPPTSARWPRQPASRAARSGRSSGPSPPPARPARAALSSPTTRPRR